MPQTIYIIEALKARLEFKQARATARGQASNSRPSDNAEETQDRGGTDAAAESTH